MSCIKNLTEKDPSNWEAAGCPLPTMMGLERRKGKDKPVICKALVELDGGMFKAYEAVRDKWAYLDCYSSGGPIQFQGAASDDLNFMVLPPNVEAMIKQTERYEEVENVIMKKNRLFRDPELLSELSKARIQDVADIPETFNRMSYNVTAVKKYFAITDQVKDQISQKLPQLHADPRGSYFVEI